jgi:hypothetical protein
MRFTQLLNVWLLAALVIPSAARAEDCFPVAGRWALHQLLRDFPELAKQGERQVVQSSEEKRAGSYYFQFAGGEVYVVDTWIREDGSCEPVQAPWRFVPALTIELSEDSPQVIARLLPRGPGFEIILPEGIESAEIKKSWADAECVLLPTPDETRLWVHLVAGDDGSGCTVSLSDIDSAQSHDITVAIGD